MKRIPLSLLLIVTLNIFAQSSDLPKDGAVTGDNEITTEARNPTQVPFAINVTTNSNTTQPTDEESQENSGSAEESIKNATWGLFWVTLVLAVFTAGLFAATYGLAKDGRKTGDRQAVEMKASIAEALRSANAMEIVATATKNNAVLMQKQMRAYIAVETGTAICQSDTLNFAASPVMTNTGFTPAKNISHRLKAAILRTAPNDYEFEDSAPRNITDATLSPRQTFIMNDFLKYKVPSEEVAAIMEGSGRRLFVWGVITYEDIFGDTWETKFCHNFVFYKDSDGVKSLGYYYRYHNSAT